MTTQGVQLVSGEVFAGHYRVERALSSGGMGAVYVVTDLNTDRQRALKVMLADVAMRPDAAARFSREARVGGSIRSEHVVEVLDAGVDEETSTPYLVMELLEGEDLADIVARRGPLPPSEVADIFAPLCHALTAAHRVKVVHRDLKPENLFMARSLRSDAEVTLKILDFGIAKIVAETQTGGVTQSIGSPLWMAPEQTQAGSRISPATDIWALGLIAFYLLTARPYWQAANQPEFAPMALLREVAMESLEPASIRARELGVEHLLPAGFDAWFERTVNREPTERFVTAEEALEALLPLLVDDASENRGLPLANTEPQPALATAGEPASTTTAATSVTAASPSTGAPARRLNAVAFAAALVVVMAGVWVWMQRGPSAAESTARSAAAASSSSAPELREPKVGLDAVRLYVSPPGPRRRDLVAASFWLAAAKDFAEAAGQTGAPVRWRAAQRFCEGQVALIEGDHADAAAAFREAIELEPEWAVPHTGLALALSRSGEEKAALDAALAAARFDPGWYRPLVVSAAVYARAGKLEEALQERRRALEKHPDNASLMAEVALGCHAVRLDSEAARFAKDALERDPQLVTPRILLAEVALEKGDGKTALDHATRAAAADPRNAATHLARADALVLEGQDKEAKHAYTRALHLADEAKVEDAQRGRWKLVREALAAGRLPPPRGESLTPRRAHASPPPPEPHRTPVMPRPSPAPPHRTACAPGDPLCGDM